jgi:hypothetical protein
VTFTAPTNFAERWDRASQGTYPLSVEGASRARAASGAVPISTAVLSRANGNLGVEIAIAPAAPMADSGTNTEDASSMDVSSPPDAATPPDAPTPIDAGTSDTTPPPVDSGSPDVAPPPDSGSGGLHVDPPIAPQPYALPTTNVVSVSTSAALVSALRSGTVSNIVIDDGTYTNSSYVAAGAAHHVFARNLGRVVIQYQIIFGGNATQSGAELHGVHIAPPDYAHIWSTNPGGISTWGNWTNLVIQDCWFDGAGAGFGANSVNGIMSLSSAGLVVQRSVFTNWTGDALRIHDNEAGSYPTNYTEATTHVSILSDIDIDGVTRWTATGAPDPTASNGTSEAGLFIGHPVDHGVTRIRVRNVAVSGIETVGHSRDTTFSHLDIDMASTTGPHGNAAQVGIYCEHYTLHNTFDTFTIGPNVRDGINNEWDDGLAGQAGSHFNTYRNGRINASSTLACGAGSHGCVGIYFDAGSESPTVTNVTFEFPSATAAFACIGWGFNSVGTLTQSGNVCPAGVPLVNASHY